METDSTPKPATPEACVECYKRQRKAEPKAKPGCILIDKLAPIGQGITDRNREGKKVAFGQVTVWADKNNCPAILKERLGGPVYESLNANTGRSFRSFNHRGSR
jgi:hypothetical protein